MMTMSPHPKPMTDEEAVEAAEATFVARTYTRRNWLAAKADSGAGLSHDEEAELWRLEDRILDWDNTDR